MENKKKHILLVFLVFIATGIFSQEEKQRKWALNGYLTNMQSVMFEDVEKDWVSDNLVHNRLNFKWYISNSLTSSLEVRTRFIYGESLEYIPDYADLIDVENGWLDLSGKIISRRSFLLHSAVDRLWLDFMKGKWQITAGRQRINWGQTFVWNANDIFNAYSFFDFDYPEKPGSDALRVQYYTGAMSKAEIAVKADNNDKLTAAGLYKFNKWNYDIQVIAGMLAESDFIAGLGWAGNLWSAAFRGEAVYFHPEENPGDTSGIFVASAGIDYSFKNGLFVQAEFLYNQQKGDGINSFNQYYYMPLTAKNLSFTEHNLFVQASYPFNPLLNGTLSVMYFPEMEGFFLGPAASLSLKDNLELSLNIQTFHGKFSGGDAQDFTMSFLRLKGNF